MNTNQVATTSPTLPGLLPDADALRLAKSFHTYDEGGRIILDRMPTALERQMLERRSAALGAALRPIGHNVVDRADAGKIIAGLLVGYGYARGDKRSDQTVTVYVTHLESVPLFAIRAACEDVKAGRVFDVDQRTGNRRPLNPDKEPSTIRLRSVAQKHVDELATERWRFDKILTAKRALPPIPSAEERGRIAGHFRDLGATLIAKTASEDAEEAKRQARVAEEKMDYTNRSILAEYERFGIEPVRGDDGALRSLSTLKLLGWTVEETSFGGEVRCELIAPMRADVDDR